MAKFRLDTIEVDIHKVEGRDTHRLIVSEDFDVDIRGDVTLEQLDTLADGIKAYVRTQR